MAGVTLRPVTLVVAALALVLVPGSAARAAAPVCETPPAQTLEVVDQPSHGTS